MIMKIQLSVLWNADAAARNLSLPGATGRPPPRGRRLHRAQQRLLAPATSDLEALGYCAVSALKRQQAYGRASAVGAHFAKSY